MNIIVIDYAFTSDEKLKRICDELNLNYEILLRDKKRFKMHKIWIDITSKTMIAYTQTNLLNVVNYMDSFKEVFENIPHFQPKPVELPSPEVDLNIDSILDKISKYGIDSLLKEEKDFLDNSSK